SGEGKAYDLRVSSRSEHEVIFQLPLVPVVDQAHPWVHLLVFDLSVRRNVRAPLLRIVPAEIIHLSGQFLCPCNLGVWVSPYKSHAEDRTGVCSGHAAIVCVCGWLLTMSDGVMMQRQHGFRRR